MKRWVLLSVLAIVSGGSVFSAGATGIPASGTACGTTAAIDPVAAGTLQPGESDWYDASYGSGGARELKVDALPPPDPSNFEDQVRLVLYAWDRSDDTCTAVGQNSCFYGDLLAGCPQGWVGFGGGTVVQPGPGDYQVKVERPSFHSTPTAYTVAVKPQV